MPDPAHRPSGTYPAHAAVHVLDLDAAADRLLARLPGNRRQTETLAREGGTALLLMAMEAGDRIDEHSAPGPVQVQALRGHVSLTAAGERVSLRPGQAALLQPGVRHDLLAEAQSVVLLAVGGSGT